MKLKQDFEVEFKEVSYVCGCGSFNIEVMLVFNGYGFTDSHCKKCGRRYKLEVDDKVTYAKSI